MPKTPTKKPKILKNPLILPEKLLNIKEKKEIRQEYIEKELEIIRNNDYNPDEYIEAISELERWDGSGEMPFRIQRFCNEYVIHYNEEVAAQKAGWPIWNASALGRRLISNPFVQKEIERLQKNLTTKLQITQERVLQEIAGIAYANQQDYYDSEGELIPIHLLPRELAANVQELITDKHGNQRYKLVAKNIGLDSLAKSLSLYEKDSERSLPVDLKQFIALLPQEAQDAIKIGLAKRIGNK